MTNFMKQAHQSLYDLLCEFDRICKKHGISYYLNAGALLGAVRHQDFIPWDDDIDICLFRNDYDKLLAVFEQEADSRFIMYDYKKFSEFFDICVRIADLNFYAPTTHGQQWDDFYDKRICHTTIDLQIVDQVGKFHSLRLLLLKIIYAMAMGHRPAVDHNNFHGVMKIGSYVLPFIGKFIPLHVEMKLYEYFSKSCPGKKDCVYISNAGPEDVLWGITFERQEFGSPASAKIRDRLFSVPNQTEIILEKLYGAYMQLPQEKDRVPKHLILDD